MPTLTPASLRPLNIDELIDLKHGPFSDPRKFSPARQRVILGKILRELQDWSPDINADRIKRIKEMMKGL